MSLAAYEPLTEVIPLGKTEFRVSGLSLEHISFLIQSNLVGTEQLFNTLHQVFTEVKSDNPDVQATLNQKLSTLAVDIAHSAPGFCAAAIALAAVEDTPFEDLLTAAKRLPGPVQIDALMIIGRLTFEEAGGVKKFVGQLTSLVGALKVETKLTA